MRSTSQIGIAAAVAGIALIGTACEINIDTSGETITRTVAVDDFRQIEIGQAFEAEIVVGEDTSVEFELNAELADLIEAEVDGERLSVGLGGGLVSTSDPLRVTITTPDLDAITVGGAADVDIRGLEASDFELIVDGASDVSLAGSITDLSLDVSGAANVDLDDTAVTTAVIAIDGASSVDMDDVSSVSGKVSGASSIDVPDSGTFDIDSTGNSSID